MKCLYFWVKISIFIRNNPFFVIRQVKFLKFIVFIELVLKLMLHYSTDIYPVVFTYKTCRNIFFFFASKTDIFIFRYILGNACLLFHRYQGIVI